MNRGILTAFFLLAAAFLSPGVFSQDGGAGTANSQTIPEALLKPDRGEVPRYPQDLVIGELGQGEAPETAYHFALDLLGALAAGDKTAAILKNSEETPGAVLTEELFEEISSLEIQSYRLGGGRTEADGNVSFLVRFLGSAESITGELFLHEESVIPAANPSEKTEEEPAPAEKSDSRKARWLLDDLILEEKRVLTELKDSYRYDFSPYERFF